MYAAGFDLLSRLGWALAAAVAVVFGLRAAVVERRAARPGAAPAAVARFARRLLDAATVVAVLALLVVLALVVLDGIDR